jgi:GT2 family glycosyltransferase
MSPKPQISIVIVSYNVRGILRDCLLSIREHAGISNEVILVDNASPDGTVEMVRQEFPEVVLIASEENLGFSPGNNLGMAKANGEFILLLNPDTLVLPGALQQWLDLHQKQHAGISGPQLLNADKSLQRSTWKTPGFFASFMEMVMLHRLFKVGQYPLKNFTTDFSCDFVSGAAMLFERKWFEKLGGLDPILFWMEDVDFCYRFRKEGLTCFYFHEPQIIHLGGQSSKTNYNRVISNQLISRLKFSRKHHSSISQFFLKLVLRMHILTRILAFGILHVFRKTPKAEAYVFSWKKLNRYLYHADHSI